MCVTQDSLEMDTTVQVCNGKGELIVLCDVTVVVLCVSVCVSVCVSPLILALQAPNRLMSDNNGSSATSARKIMWRFR